MSTIVRANINAYANTVSYITDKLLTSLKLIIRDSGLDPTKFAADWGWMERGIKTWLGTRDLTCVTLEVHEPANNGLVGRWDFPIIYDYDSDGTGGMWVDTDAIRYAIQKAGFWPHHCAYRIVASTKAGRPDVDGWSRTAFLSTDGFVRHSIGTTIGAYGAGASAAYWRKG